MKQKALRFILISLLNGLIYAVIIYFMDQEMTTRRFVFQSLFFGIFMGFLQVIMPYLNRNKPKS